MSISSEISRISSNVSDALDAIEDKGVTIPSGANSDDLATLIAQISGGGTPAISVVDTTDTAGGTIRTITALDISDTTCTAADVLNSKYFYTAAGVKTQGTASGGGGSAQTETGTFTGDNSITASISCPFAPDLIYVHGDLTSDPSLRGVVSFVVIKDTMIFCSSDSSTSSTAENMLDVSHSVTGYSHGASYPHAAYSNGTLTIDMVQNSSGTRFASGVTYSYKLVGYSSVS